MSDRVRRGKPKRTRHHRAGSYDLFDIDVQDAIDDIYPGFTSEELDEIGETRRGCYSLDVLSDGRKCCQKVQEFCESG